MRKILSIFLLISTIFLSGCTLPWDKASYSGVQITSVPKASVSIDNKELGKTPFYDEKITPGEHQIRLVSDSSTLSSWEGKVKFNPLVLTVINRILGPTDILSSGENITMEELGDTKATELAVISSPDGAKVVIDKSDAGLTPFAQKNTTVGDHEVIIGLQGYTQRVVKVKTRAGYRLVINAQLAQILTQGLPISQEASSSATISGQIGLINVNPTPVENNEIPKPRVKILDTPTGWLRVHSAPNINPASEIAKINMGEIYAYEDEQAGWIKIKLNKEKDGWVSAQYVEKQL